MELPLLLPLGCRVIDESAACAVAKLSILFSGPRNER
jgi:hypothetical protein